MPTAHLSPAAGPPPETDPGIAELARLAAAAVPALGGVRLIGIDGHAGSGKSTLADALAARLGGAPVIRSDDLADHDHLFAWTGRLTEEVLAPLRGGRPARFRAYDWERRTGGAWRRVRPAPVVLLEGVGAGRRALRPSLSLLLWLDVDRAMAWERGRRRDGPAQERFWDGWRPAEDGHFRDDPSRDAADILVVPQYDGYVVRRR
ncbi:uridine kinase family protein [Streptomyces spiramenti]|uniref:Uridine kinase n=1 Tax=Streptomyces spiramenti TaxID=2720606 RepID=A0ABX1ASP3_9ACTN|nr:hypothetical protein [Streptomyces spiramenti]NJP67773.1 hypothetical protein [Streptomyces spiramenti]